MKVIVVRHGETQSNKKGLLNGRIDENLTKKGRQQAQELINELKSFKIDCIYSSPFKRAMQTAVPIAQELGAPINQDIRLLEIDHGDFTGKPYDSTIPFFGVPSVELINTYKYDFKPFNGESWQETEGRVEDFIGDLKKKDARTVLIVTHGGVVRWFYYLCKNQKVGLLPNAGLHIFEI